MFKACIVDDEKYVLESIKTRIEESDLDIKVTGIAKNGYEAYELYEKEKPDIFFVDINMPLCNGLDFVERVRKFDKNSTTRFVIISGYDNFSYTKKAIKTKVVNYILKPIQQEEFVEMLKEICMDLEAEKKQKTKLWENNIISFNEYKINNKFFSGTAICIGVNDW